ncbi:dTMP kinase [Amorphus sp. 3PC139-8]
MTAAGSPVVNATETLQVPDKSQAGPAGASDAAVSEGVARNARGRFISFEGGEGTGKTTQVRALAHRLGELGLPILKTREPGGTRGAEMIRQVLLSGAAREFGADAEAILFSAARIDHVDRTIRPALAKGVWVLCDRFADSSRVYQGLSGVETPILSAMERIALDGVKPDLTIVLDLDPAIARARAAARRGEMPADRFEGEGWDADAARRRAFRRLAVSDPRRCVVVDASGPSPEIAETVWRTVVERLCPMAAR